MTRRHRVFLDSDLLETVAYEAGVSIEFRNAANIALCVIGDVEYAAHLPNDSRADLAAVGVAATGEAVR